MMMTCDISPHILEWIKLVETGGIAACEEQKQLVAHVRRAFETEDIRTDHEQLEKYLGLQKYYPFQLFPWERFCLALHLCTYWRDTGMPRWPDLFLLIARGAGKDGFIGFEGLCLLSPYNPIPKYDVDICANAEEQAMRPVDDTIEVLNGEKHTKKLKRHFYWTKESIVGLKYRGKMRGRTSNPKSKDGMRSGIVVFNEIHQYENYKNIKVFITGLGKRPHPRRLYATTNGDVREGPLDDYLKQSEQILCGAIPDNGFLPFICRLDEKAEVNDPAMWVKANPSLPYLPHLLEETRKEYAEWKEHPVTNGDFMTKRMNRPQSDTEVAVTKWENIVATNRPLPELKGRDCVIGIDYADIGDFASVNAHFRIGEERYDINHSWLCLQSSTLHRLSCPWREWAAEGLLTLVDGVEIHPDLLCEWIMQKGQLYRIRKLALDNFRKALLGRSLAQIGFDVSDKERVKVVRPSDIAQIQPVIQSVFANQKFNWGDAPVLRWATNNTKVVRVGKKFGSETGSFYYAKIEGKSRKTDPFMALAHAMTIEDVLPAQERRYVDIPVIVC